MLKVETIGDGYMAASGAPVRTKVHAQRICDMSLEMQAGICHVKEPACGNRIRIRIGKKLATDTKDFIKSQIFLKKRSSNAYLSLLVSYKEI